MLSTTGVDKRSPARGQPGGRTSTTRPSLWTAARGRWMPPKSTCGTRPSRPTTTS